MGTVRSNDPDDTLGRGRCSFAPAGSCAAAGIAVRTPGSRPLRLPMTWRGAVSVRPTALAPAPYPAGRRRCWPDTQARRSRRVGCRGLLLCVCVAVLAACATGSGPSRPGAAPDPGAEDHAAAPPRWWYVRFRLHRGDDDETQSYLDGLIADRLLAGLVDGHRDDIVLWRFHRRWARDAIGHQFSFMFFAPPAPANALLARIARHPLLTSLRDDGLLREYRVDALDPPEATDPAATSDPAWPAAIRREWPTFIMGASRMWLGLVRDEAARHPTLGLHARYRAVEARLDELWYRNGNHAFLHHLSALFGYKPVRVIRRDIMTF